MVFIEILSDINYWNMWYRLFSKWDFFFQVGDIIYI